MPLNFVRNDITRMRVDAIVNAANNSLLGGGGVDGAIHRAAGPGLLEECRRLHGCETGASKRTGGYNLPCRYVIHTVGPIWRGGGHGEAELLAGCYRSALALAGEARCESIAFPMISTGAYGYPRAEALQIAVREITHFLLENDMTVYIVLFTGEAVELTGRLFGEITSYIDDVYVAQRYDPNRETASRRLNLESVQAKESALPRLANEPDLSPARREDAMPARPRATRRISPAALPNLDEMLARMDEGFAAMLLREIDARHMTDAECYRRANIDRRLFNKIKNNPGYRPSKQTVLAFALALRLSLDETREMLAKAGFALSRSSKADIVVEYCIRTGNYDIFEINQVLFKLDLQPLGY